MRTCIIVAGGDATQRTATIGVLLARPALSLGSIAIILEGVHEGVENLKHAHPTAKPHIVNIAAGCPCCNNGLVMRVTLDRMMHRQPATLIVSLADARHVPHLQHFLGRPSYAQHLTLELPILCKISTALNSVDSTNNSPKLL